MLSEFAGLRLHCSNFASLAIIIAARMTRALEKSYLRCSYVTVVLGLCSVLDLFAFLTNDYLSISGFVLSLSYFFDFFVPVLRERTYLT